MPADLLPAESIALTVALAQVRRGDEPTPNVAAVCVLALARVDGRYDYTTDDRAACPECGVGVVVPAGPMEQETGHWPLTCSRSCGWTN